MPIGPGRQVLTLQVAATLGDAAADYYIDGIVVKILDEYGFVDLDEVPMAKYQDIVNSCARARMEALSGE